MDWVRRRCPYLCYPQRGFEIVIWAIIVGWVVFGLGNTYRLWYWEMDMAKERQALQQQVEVLQEYIKNNNIGHTFD